MPLYLSGGSSPEPWIDTGITAFHEASTAKQNYY